MTFRFRLTQNGYPNLRVEFVGVATTMLDDVIKLLFEVERRDVLTVHKTTLDRHVTGGSDLELVV